MRTIFLKRLAVVFFAAALYAQSSDAAWHKTIAAAQKQAKASRQLILVDMFADWCGWCHKMEKEVFPTEVFQKQTDDMVLLRLNTEDNGEGRALAQKFSVAQLPTFLILTPELELAAVLHGYAAAPEFAKRIGAAREQYKVFEKLARSEATFGSDYKKRLELAKEFTARYAFAKAETRLSRLTTDPKAPVAIRDAAFVELAITQVLQSKFDEAMKTLGAFARVQSSGESFEKGRLVVAEIFVRQGNFAAAAHEYRTFKQRFPKSALIANVDAVLPQVERLIAQGR